MRHEVALSHAIAAAQRLGENLQPAREVPDFSGHWKNELDSFMDLTIAGTTVAGSYTSLVSGLDHPVCGPIIGYVSGDVISFTVLWPPLAHSITSWVRQLVIEDDGQHRIHTLWHLIRDIEDAQNPRSTWKTINSGADIFFRG